MDKEPWVYKKGDLVTLETFNKAFKEVQPKLKEDFDKLMNQDIPDGFKQLLSSRQ